MKKEFDFTEIVNIKLSGMITDKITKDLLSEAIDAIASMRYNKGTIEDDAIFKSISLMSPENYREAIERRIDESKRFREIPSFSQTKIMLEPDEYENKLYSVIISTKLPMIGNKTSTKFNFRGDIETEMQFDNMLCDAIDNIRATGHEVEKTSYSSPEYLMATMNYTTSSAPTYNVIMKLRE